MAKDIPSVKHPVEHSKTKLQTFDRDEEGNDALVRAARGDILQPAGNHIDDDGAAIVERLPDTKDEAELGLAGHDQGDRYQERDGVERRAQRRDDHGAQGVGLREPDQAVHQDPDGRGEADDHHAVAKRVEEEADQRRADDGDDLLDGRCVAGDLGGRAARRRDDVGVEAVEAADDAGLQDLRARHQPEEARDVVDRPPDAGGGEAAQAAAGRRHGSRSVVRVLRAVVFL